MIDDDVAVRCQNVLALVYKAGTMLETLSVEHVLTVFDYMMLNVHESRYVGSTEMARRHRCVLQAAQVLVEAVRAAEAEATYPSAKA